MWCWVVWYVWCDVICMRCGAVWCSVMWFYLMRCDAVWFGVMWCDAVWCGVMWWCFVMRCDMCDAMWLVCDVMLCNVMRCNAVWCHVMWCDAIRCNALWFDAVWCHNVLWCDSVSVVFEYHWFSIGLCDCVLIMVHIYDVVLVLMLCLGSICAQLISAIT